MIRARTKDLLPLLIVAALATPCTARAENAIIGLTLINADTDEPIREIVSGDTINLATLPTRRLNVLAETDPSVGKVHFRVNARDRFRRETARPFAMAGDRGGDFLPWTPKEGVQEITAVPYRNNKAGEAYTVRFTVVSRAASGQRARFDEDAAVVVSTRSSVPANKLEFIDSETDAAKTCRGFVSSDTGYLTVVCSHDFEDAVTAKLIVPEEHDGGLSETFVCDFLNTASPMITACATSESLVSSFRRGDLAVAIQRTDGSRAALPVAVR